MFALSNRPLINSELDESAEIYTDELFDVIPFEMLKPAWNRAKSNNRSSFAPNAFDLIRAFNELEEMRKNNAEKERYERIKHNPILMCAARALHFDRRDEYDRGEIQGDPFQTGKDEIFPCPTCRHTAYENWKKKQIALYGSHPPQTLLKPQIAELVAKANFAPPKIIEILPPPEANALAAEHNELVKTIITEPETAKNLILIYDEGAEVFRHPARPTPLFSAKDVRGRVEKYREIAETKNEK